MSVNEMKKISELPSELFNGVTNPYVPGPELQYSAKLNLHSYYEIFISGNTRESRLSKHISDFKKFHDLHPNFDV